MLELIIDSGGTTSDWVLLKDNAVLTQFTSLGMNPVKADLELILSKVSLVDYPEISKVHFYGAGCSTASLCDTVRRALINKLPNTLIYIETDLLGAARASCQDQAGIIGILGTGSSLCRYDGDKIINGVPSGGYLIGDEGSGFAIGQAIIRDYLRGKLSSEEKRLVDELYASSDLLSLLYSHDQPNALIASFSKSLMQFSDPRKQEIVKPLFTKMIIERLNPLDIGPRDKLYFIGSIAFHYQKELRDALNSFSLQVEKIERSPMSGLINYHIEHKL